MQGGLSRVRALASTKCYSPSKTESYPTRISYSELKGAWAASRLRGFINISDRSELPRHMRKWHWTWVQVGLAREVSDWSRVSHICWLDSDATTVPHLEYISDPAHRHLGRSLVFRSLKCLVVPRSANKSARNLEARLPEPNARHERNPSQRLVGLLGDQ